MAGEAKKPKTWHLWERSNNPPGFQMQPRDFQILVAVFRHRFLKPSHVHALFPDGSPDRLSRRMRLLWQHGYLERPKSIRPTRVLTEEIVYALSKKGAQLLEHMYPELRIGHLDWNETPKKQLGLPYIDHQLGIATVMVCMRLAAQRHGIEFHWDGHFNRRRWKIVPPGDREGLLPDAHFTLEIPGRGVAHHFLEVDRANVSLSRMQDRYLRYFEFWRDSTTHRAFKHFRVLTVAQDPDYVPSLRKAAEPIGRDRHHPNTWRGLMFSHLEAFTLDQPVNILEPVWLYADESQHVTLI